MGKFRVRFAPSPTGPLHIGGLRTALFNYLFAKKHGGKFILRIEDTDRTRFVPGAEEYIVESLSWCGIDADEGIGAGKQGPYGPYRQSERKDLYGAFAEKLLDLGSAYYAFDTPEELEKWRKEFEEWGETFSYDSSTRMRMRNSLTYSEAETSRLIEKGVPYVLRFRFAGDEVITMRDLVRGELEVGAGTLDDKVLFKSDGIPTYHLANVVDDHEMKITHVIRGEEWLPSLPLHVMLYKALGWEEEMPEFAHLPLLLKPDGKGKLSKRDGDKGGFPVFPLDWRDSSTGEVSPGYREAGYFPEACINILAFLGWNPGTEKELYSLDELISDFDLEKVGRSGAKFDPDKAKWFNHQYLQQRPVEELARDFRKILQEKGVQAENDKLKAIIELTRERAGFVADLWEHAAFFFKAPEEYDKKAVQKRWNKESSAIMNTLSELLSAIEPFDAATIEERVKAEIAERGWSMGAVMNSWRLLLVGELKGPSLFATAEILGRKEVTDRIKRGIIALG